MKISLLLLCAIALAATACTSVSTDPKSGVTSKTEFNPPAAMWEVLGNLSKRSAPAPVTVKAEK